MTRYVLYRVDSKGFHIFDLVTRQSLFLLSDGVFQLLHSGMTIIGLERKVVSSQSFNGWTFEPVMRETLVYDSKCKEGIKFLRKLNIKAKQLL